MYRNSLEHPDISRTLRDGHPIIVDVFQNKVYVDENIVEVVTVSGDEYAEIVARGSAEERKLI